MEVPTTKDFSKKKKKQTWSIGLDFLVHFLAELYHIIVYRMPQQINVNGIKALIKHNVIKALAKEKLSKKQYIATLKIIENFIDSASIVDLKQKGIVKNIVNTALGNKSNHIIKGEGKRKREQ